MLNFECFFVLDIFIFGYGERKSMLLKDVGLGNVNFFLKFGLVKFVLVFILIF